MEKLAIKILTDTITEAELVVLRKLLQDKANKKTFEDLIRANLYLDTNHIWDTDTAFDSVLSRIAQKEKPVKRLFPSWIKYVAASVVILLATSLYFSNQFNNNNLSGSKAPLPIIVAGTNKAILTLETGVDVALGNGKTYSTNNVKSSGENIVYVNNDKPESAETIAYNTLTIPRGGQFFIKLSDGTKVWINSESKLKYPVAFIKGQTREVELVYGEAYFEVSPSTLHSGAKFKVNNALQDIEVLGTKFNVKAYKEDAQITTSLVEGKVQVENTLTGSVLKPGQASYLDKKSKAITVDKVDVESVIAWKDGHYIFSNESLLSMTKTLSRWYNVDFSFKNLSKQQIRFTGVLNRSDNVNVLLKKIEKTDEISFTVEKNSIVIK